jgi:hypothetical protein
LHEPPSRPHPSYDQLARYDAKGLVWVLEGRAVVAMTEATAAIETKTGTIINYRKFNKPGLGPVSDSISKRQPDQKSPGNLRGPALRVHPRGAWDLNLKKIGTGE